MKRIVLGAVVAIFAIGSLTAPAAEPREYAYLLVQGKVSAARTGAGAYGIDVKLRGDGGSYSATSDERGIFVFEHVPIGVYELDIFTADGLRVHKTVPLAVDRPGHARARVRAGRQAGEAIRIVPHDAGEIVIEIPQPPTRWGRLGKQALVFVGVAALLVL